MKWWLNLGALYLVFTAIAVYLVYAILYPSSTLPKYIFLTYLILRVCIGMFIFMVYFGVFSTREAIRNLYVLGIAGLLFSIAFTLETISFFLLNSKAEVHKDLSIIFFDMSQFLITVAPIMLMYFIVRYFEPSASFLAFLPISIDFAFEIVFQSLGITRDVQVLHIENIEVSHWIYNPIYFWINVIYFVSISWIVIYIYYLILGSRSITLDKNIIKIQNTFLYGIFTMFILSPLIFFLHNFINHEFLRFIWIGIVGRAFLILGMALFTYTFYISSKQYDFFQPQPVDALYLLNADNGELIYHRKFNETPSLKAETDIASNISMINKMLGDALGFNSLMTEINLENKEYLVRNLIDWNLISILVVRHTTNVIKERYDNLASMLVKYSEYGNEILDQKVDEVFGL